MKIYTKPDIMFESFELAENIASCDLISNGDHGKYECAILDPESGWTIFNVGINNCMLPPESYGGNFCYEVPLDAVNVFSS